MSKPVAVTGDISNYNWIGNQGIFNNISVPNVRVSDVSRQSYGDPSPFLGNPLYARFASNPSSSTVTGDALLVNPTFFMVWLGMEDIYNFARTGGDQGNDSITSVAYFDVLYNNLIDELTSQHAKGVLLNIPAMHSFPFFTQIAYNGLFLNNQQAAQLNALYATVDSTISFSAGYNHYVIADPAVPSGRRSMKKEGDVFLLSTPIDSINCQGWGTTMPIPQRYVLDTSEVTRIKNSIISYNSIITIASVTYNLDVADINSYMSTLESGIRFNGVNYSNRIFKRRSIFNRWFLFFPERISTHCE